MREKEIREELELSVRAFVEARERSEKQALDQFDELRILEASFNRLFISVEHLCNAIVLVETGNFSKKHFGDLQKLKGLKEKYKADLAATYQTSYNFRSYADYRKCPEVGEKFKREELKDQIKNINKILLDCLVLIGKHIEIKNLVEKIPKV